MKIEVDIHAPESTISITMYYYCLVGVTIVHM